MNNFYFSMFSAGNIIHFAYSLFGGWISSDGISTLIISLFLSSKHLRKAFVFERAFVFEALGAVMHKQLFIFF